MMGIQEQAEKMAGTPEQLVATMRHFKVREAEIVSALQTRFGLQGKTVIECLAQLCQDSGSDYDEDLFLIFSDEKPVNDLPSLLNVNH